MTPVRVVLLAVAGVALVIGPLVIFKSFGEPVPEPAWTPSPQASPNECKAPKFAPTYLPWAEGSVGKPERLDTQDTFILRWTSPPDYGPEASVSLARRFARWRGNKAYPSVPVRGTEGKLVWIGDPGVGELVLQWSEGDEPCDHYGLFLFDQSLDQREAEDELARISRSLR